MTIEILELKSELALVYKEHTTNAKSDKVIEKGINMVSAYLEELGIEPSGTPFVAYLNCTKDWSKFDLEVGFPIAESVATKDGMFMSKTHEGKAVVATHKGSHRSINTTYGKMFEFMDEQSLEFTGTFFDCYLTDPAITPTKEMQTKVIVPV
ncbi:MAG: GyrI-like domain-containing protein [Prevotellaceae bacterium]|jgi:effector-binding domain-containing protein|nr:GyrI-like domain-containing protein [Prevotellaceae bacterium]